MSKIALYAELLLNIRQVTLFVTLPSNADRETTISLSPDCRSITVIHQGTKHDLELPCQVAPSAALHTPIFKAKELSFRLQVAGDLDLAQTVWSSSDSHDTPWPASSLTPETCISCRSCRNFLVKECISAWKDLPSEDWADMMDFWHCHKPNTEEAQKDHTHGLTKGYAASNGLAPSPSVGLVDTSHIILQESDCLGLQSSNESQLNLECSSCSGIVGIQDQTNGTVRLLKSSLRLQLKRNATWEVYPVQKFICAQLLALIRSQATHKFLVCSEDIDDAREALLLWVFNPDLIYSTSIHQGHPKRAIKIFYQTVLNPSSILEKQSMTVDDIRLPHHVLHTLHADLRASGEILPASARRLQDWDVGLLNR